MISLVGEEGSFFLRVFKYINQNFRIFRSGTLSLCNCFAAGVFLATCFLGLVPHTTLIGNQINERLFSQGDHKHSLHSHNELGTTTNSHNDGHLHSHERNTWLQILFDPNLMILIGFLFTLFVEQVLFILTQLVNLVVFLDGGFSSEYANTYG